MCLQFDPCNITRSGVSRDDPITMSVMLTTSRWTDINWTTVRKALISSAVSRDQALSIDVIQLSAYRDRFHNLKSSQECRCEKTVTILPDLNPVAKQVINVLTAFSTFKDMVRSPFFLI